MSLPDEDFRALLTSNGISALSPAVLAKDFETYPREWYHLQFYETDFPLFFSWANLKWYAVCRCRPIKEENSLSNAHSHALVHFKDNSSLWTFKKKLRQIAKRLHQKTFFKKILCLDGAVEVLHCISCSGYDPEFPKKGDSFHADARVHYSRTVFKSSWLHDLGEECFRVKEEMSTLTADSVADLSKYSSRKELHVRTSCLCKNGIAGREKSVLANRKRREFHLSKASDRVNVKYRKTVLKKNKLLVLLRELTNKAGDNVDFNAEPLRAILLKLIKL